ncbi:MAG TPA: Rieske 2Fe-2S domain-containing protein [Acidimicrobiales bacterium]|nr:Rieske 2Fe-2S domain-containing protein [Acidimicrobiales bacterium]
MPLPLLDDLVDRISHSSALDKVAEPVASAVQKVVPHGPVKDLLSGTWLGHPLHPMLTDLAIGSWTSAFVLDLVGGNRSRRASDSLIGFGVVSALPTAAAGLSDWSDTYGEDRRIGVVHAIGNVTAVACYSLSYVARRRGRRAQGLTWSFVGATAATVGGYLGGHLSYRRGVNVNRQAWDHAPDDWQIVADESVLTGDAPLVVKAGDVDVLLMRRDGDVFAIADVCTHAGGPLHEGEIDDENCVTCPWHSSTFRLADGGVVHGPATAPQPAYDTKVEGGKISVRPRH